MPEVGARRSSGTPNGHLPGVEAVVDKDRTSAILAVSVKADALLLLTDVAGVEVGFGTPDAQTIGRHEHRRAAPARPSRRIDGAQGRWRCANSQNDWTVCRHRGIG